MNYRQWMCYDPDASRGPTVKQRRAASWIAAVAFGCFAFVGALALKSCSDKEASRVAFEREQMARYHAMVFGERWEEGEE